MDLSDRDSRADFTLIITLNLFFNSVHDTRARVSHGRRVGALWADWALLSRGTLAASAATGTGTRPR
jgi:hypothetical protein